MNKDFVVSQMDTITTTNLSELSDNVSKISDLVSDLYDQNVDISADIAQIHKEQLKQYDRIYSLQLFKDRISERFILEDDELIRKSAMQAKYIISFSTFSVRVYQELSWFRRILLKLVLGCKIRKVKVKDR